MKVKVNVWWLFGGDERYVTKDGHTLASVSTYDAQGLLAGNAHAVFSAIAEKTGMSRARRATRLCIPNAPYSAGAYWEFEMQLDDDAIALLETFERAKESYDACIELYNAGVMSAAALDTARWRAGVSEQLPTAAQQALDAAATAHLDWAASSPLERLRPGTSAAYIAAAVRYNFEEAARYYEHLPAFESLKQRAYQNLERALAILEAQGGITRPGLDLAAI